MVAIGGDVAKGTFQKQISPYKQNKHTSPLLLILTQKQMVVIVGDVAKGTLLNRYFSSNKTNRFTLMNYAN